MAVVFATMPTPAPVDAASTRTVVFIHGVFGQAGKVDHKTFNSATYASYNNAWAILKSTFTKAIGVTYYGSSPQSLGDFPCTSGTTPACANFNVRYVGGSASTKDACLDPMLSNVLGTGGSILNGYGPLQYAYHVAWYLRNIWTTSSTPYILVGHSQGGLVARTIRLLAGGGLTATQRSTANDALPTSLKIGTASDNSGGCWPDLTGKIAGLVTLDAPHRGLAVDFPALNEVVTTTTEINSCADWILASLTNAGGKVSDFAAIYTVQTQCSGTSWALRWGAVYKALWTKALSDTIQVGVDETSDVHVIGVRIGGITKTSSLGTTISGTLSSTNRSWNIGLRGPMEHEDFWAGICPYDGCASWSYPAGVSGARTAKNLLPLSSRNLWSWLRIEMGQM